MDQEATMDFKALRAKFQGEELLLKQPVAIKPALPEKPKVVPPPQSPPHYLPAGARPSLLTSINQSLEGKSVSAPRVIFKEEDKKESKKPLLQINSKGKDKSEGKLKKSKDKATKGSKEKLDEDVSEQKPKKENSKKLFPATPKESTAELVPATAPPKATQKKKGFLGFTKSSKKISAEVPADPILDIPSSDAAGPAPLIPISSDFVDAPAEPKISAPPKALLPNIPTLPDSSAAVEITPPFTIPASPDFMPPPAFIPDIPPHNVPTPESETPLEIETPALPVSPPASQIEIIPDPPSAAPTPPPISVPPPPVASSPSPSPPEPEIEAEAVLEAVSIAAVETPPPPVTDTPSIPPSPKAERRISALSVLSRAEDMSPPKRVAPCDQRILSALEKARRKTSPLTNPSPSASITPPPQDIPPSPPSSVPDLPPIDYVGNLPPKPVNGFDHRQASPQLEGITEEVSDIPELLVVPPPPPKKILPDPKSLGPAPEKPDRPPSVNLSDFIPPPPLEEIPAPLEFSETDTTDVPEFDDVTSDAHSPELPVSDWGNGDYTGPDTPDGQNLPEFYSNGITPPAAEVDAPAFGDVYQDNLNFPMSHESSQLESPQLETSTLESPKVETSTLESLKVETPTPAGLQVEVANGVCEGADNVYEDISTSATKKKKSDGGKKRKGPPKNPYAEAQQETNEEKSKMGRFSKIDKKAVSEGPDEKELKKKEKQRLEKEKKELKEKQEREKKEQKEREKKENEMKKKFKITGQEDAMYEAKVTVTTKGRKNDLAVTSGDIVSIIRTTNCPKGKWLARDSSNNYGYIAVDHVELDIKEMMELGKKAAITRKTNNNNNNVVEEEVTSTGSRVSNHYPMSAGSFTDDSEEWTGDDDDHEPLSPPPVTEAPLVPMGHTRTLSMPDMENKNLSINHQHSQSDLSAEGPHVQARHEALQKLATFFHSPKPVEPAASSTEPETSPVLVEEEEADPLPESSSTQEIVFDATDMIILPPPDLYADFTGE